MEKIEHIGLAGMVALLSTAMAFIFTKLGFFIGGLKGSFEDNYTQNLIVIVIFVLVYFGLKKE